MNEVVVRIAPSPSKAEGKEKSGLHLGNVRTALFNYLYANGNKGAFIFRVEDTDTARCSETGAEDILAELNWLGLNPNRGYGAEDKPAEVYTQLGRLPIYQKYVDQLLAEGKAYKCYCTTDELDKARNEALEKNPKAPFRYPGTCRELKALPNKGYVIRLRAPKEGSVEFTDLVFGKVSIPNKENYDFVICRENGIPLFNFANAIDDFFIDKVSHIIRGRDHLANTPIQMLIGQALGFTDFPTYIHLPMMLGPGGGKLSKRDGAVSVREFRDAGYAPKAILNYLSRFGWSAGNQEIFSMEELIAKFDLKRVNKSDGKFDYKKFLDTNYQHLKSESLLPDAEYVKHLKPFMDSGISEDTLLPLVSLVRSRAKTFVEAANMLTPILKYQPNDELMKLVFSTDEARNNLVKIKDALAAVETWGVESIKASLLASGLTLKDVGAALRVALLGRKDSPEIVSTIQAIGKKETITRLEGSIVSFER